MAFVQAAEGGGGWPLNVFLTPDLKPFFGGTYWPPEPKLERPSFIQILNQVNKAWRERRDELVKTSQEIQRQLQMVATHQTEPLVLSQDALRKAGELLKQGYDPKHGGWGEAPKFPSPSHPNFLLIYGRKFKDQEAVDMVLRTCERMASGGIYDQLGGGFHRYSVDEKWLVPHFEKMLYDNAQLIRLNVDCYLVSGEQRYAEVARGVIRYVLRDMTHPDGGFYSAEDADSEGKEGKFYAWTRQELSALITPEELNAVTKAYGITDKGNFVDHSDPDPLPNQNVLSVVSTNLSGSEERQLRSAKEKLFKARGRRVRPHLDDKVLSSWNGLMLGALAHAYGALGDEAFLIAAQNNMRFLRSKLWDSRSKTLYHRWRDGERDAVQLLEPYSFLLAGTIDLYQVTLNPEHLEFAVQLAESMLERFYDKDNGGFWQAATNATDLILRIKESDDSAEPSGNSVAILALLKLASITERKEFRECAEKSLRLFSPRIDEVPQSMPFMLGALNFGLQEPKRVVVAGDANSPSARKLIHAAYSVYEPNKVVLGTSGPVEPFARTLPIKDNQPTVYLCTGTSCLPPTHDPEKVKQLLR